ncbi:MFS transporter [Bacillus salitolerans]|uniref:MFS transporter n=1 Tax=Bacillus salitolerans TaxID=1437434 RepID=A0ABW4LRL1_9BACI
MLWIEKKQPSSISLRSRPSIWKNVNFIILLLSGSIMTFGSKIYELALPLILYQFTHSAVTMSTMRGIEFLPNLFLAMFIGVFVDRADKKRWTLWSIFLQIILLIILYLSVQYGKPSPILFYICGFLLMTFNYAFINARMSIVKQALPTSMLTSANASFNFVHTFIGIMGPALTGLILMLSSLYTGLLITVIAFSISFFILLLLKTEAEQSVQKKEGFWRELKEGWIELYRNKALWLITLAVIFINSTAGMVDTTVIFFAKDVLDLSNAELGLVLSSAGLGGLIGSFFIGKVRNYFGTGAIVTITTLLIGFSYFILFMASSSFILAIGLFFNGLLSTICSVSIWTYRQESTPHHLIGRISGITGSVFKLSMPFAIFSAGWISELINPSHVFMLAFIGNVMIFVCCRFSRLWGK